MKVSDPWLRGKRQWYATILDGPEKGRQVSLKTTDEAAAWTAVDRLRRGQPIEPAKVIQKPRTAHALRELYLADLPNIRKPKTVAWYKFALSTLPDWTIDAITDDKVQLWLASARGVGNTKNGMLTALVRLLNWGVSEKYIATNPIRGIKKRLSGVLPGYQPRVVYLTIEQRRAMLDKCLNPGGKKLPRPDLLQVLTVLFSTGARPFEIRIAEAKHLHGGTLVLPVADAKKKRKERRIVLRGESLALVKELAAKYPNGPLFRRTSGKPWTASGLGHAVRAVAELAGVKCSPYAFRHSVATDATRAKENPIILATALGTSVAMLESVYAHINDADVQGLSDRLGY